MVVLRVATLWVTTQNAPFSDRNKSFQTFLKTFEIASRVKEKTPALHEQNGSWYCIQKKITSEKPELLPRAAVSAEVLPTVCGKLQ